MDNMENDEMIIDLRVLLWEMLKKWHIILIVGIIGAIAMGALGAVKNMDTTLEDMSIKELQKEMEDTEINTVKNVISLWQQIDEKLGYKEESVYLSVDWTDEDAACIDYMLNSNKDNKYIRQMYISFIEDGELCSRINQEYNEIDVKCLNELIYYRSNNGRANINEDSEENYDKGDDLNRILSVGIIGKDKEQCEKLQGLVAKHIMKYHDEVAAKYEGHAIEEVGSSISKVIDTNLANTQSTWESQLNTLYTQYQQLYTNLSEQQLALYDKMLDTGKEDEEVESGIINKKYILIGGVLGVFMVAAVIILLSIVKDKVYVQRQITDRIPVRVFGTYGKNNSRFAKSILGDTGRDSEQDFDVMISKIKLYCSQSEIANLYLQDNTVSTNGKDKYKKILDSLTHIGVQCKSVDFTNASDINEEITSSESSVVVVEELGERKSKEVSKNLKELQEMYVMVGGIICVE